MLSSFRFLLVLFTFTLGMPIAGITASFDCSKSTTLTEEAICSNPELSALDSNLGQLYVRARKISKNLIDSDLNLKNEQKNWLDLRNSCGLDIDCLSNAYVSRINELGDYDLEALNLRLLKQKKLCSEKAQEGYDSGVTRLMLNATVQYNNCLENILEDLLLATTNYDPDLIASDFEKNRSSYTNIIYHVFNNKKTCAPTCGTMYTLYPESYYTDQLESIFQILLDENNLTANVGHLSIVQNCTQEDRDYAEFWDNYYDPEVAYKFGETIQQIFERRDLPALLELIPNELVSGFRKSDAIDADFTDIISDQVADKIISASPECSPVGWRGHTLGNGDLWYSCNKTECHIVSIHETGMDIKYEKEGFVLNDQTLSADCFPYPWLSSDNYEEIADKFSIDIDNPRSRSTFFENTGIFFGGKIDEYNISIVGNLKSCGRAEAVDIVDGRVRSPNYLSYQVVDTEIADCDALVPNIDYSVIDCRLIFLREETGGSMGSYDIYAIYGVVDLPIYREAILPIKFFETQNDALNFVYDRK